MGVHVLRAAIDKQGFFGLAQGYLERTDDLLRHIILDLEDVGEIAVVALSPEMSAARSVDQLGGDANPVARLANAAFQREPDAEFPAHIGNIERLVLVDEGRVPGDDEQSGHFRQIRDDVLADAVAEIFLLRIPAHIVERKHDDRWLVGQRLGLFPPDRRGRGRSVANPALDVHRPVDVLDLLFPQILEGHVNSIAHLIIDGRRYVNSARIG